MITLHGHSDYSLLDGICKIPDYVARAKELGAEAVGLTDHGTLAGLVDLWFECKKQGIKPILGCEFYHVRKKSDKKNYHIILLARTYEGWMNMIELSNRAQDNFYKKPRITDKDIRELGRGIIGTAACLAGYLARTWAETGEFDHEWIKMMENSFDAFYFEVHDNGIPEQKAYNNALLKAYPDRCIAANDVHFLLEEHQFAHEVALAINTRKKITDPKAFKFNGSGYWMRSDLDLPEHTITRTHEVAALVEEFSIGYDEWHLPQVDVDEENLWFRLNDELFVRGLDKPEYRERMEYEFKVIKENGFLPYFEIVSSIYRRFALEGRFVGWGRGSTGGSLVAYLMGITRIDPIEWGLIFERFLNPGRVTMPDIDMDFQPQDRALAIEELGRYGNAIQIGAYGTLGTKEVLNAVSKAMDIVTGLGALVPNEAPVPTIAELATTRAFSEQVAKERNQKLIEVCKILEGCKRSASTHAAGVVLVEGTIPVRESRSGVNKGLRSSEWDMYALEKLRYVKFDVLGVKNLEVVDATCRSVGIRPEEIPLADDATYSLIQSGQTIGVFQWESDGYRNLIRRLHPDSFDELLDLNTLYRPGCLESGITDEYIERKFGRKPVVQLHPKLNMRTQGLPLYQEDILVMARELAGFTLAEADILRKAIGKKEKETFAKIKEQFVDGCIQVSDISRSDADDYWSQIEKFARYTWNKAHAVAYTLISW
jgi:DNA polymerase-3 subunit alpha